MQVQKLFYFQVYKQKIKHLLYEHQCNVEALKVEAEEKVKAALNSCKAREDALLEDKVTLKERLRVQVNPNPFCPSNFWSLSSIRLKHVLIALPADFTTGLQGLSTQIIDNKSAMKQNEIVQDKSRFLWTQILTTTWCQHSQVQSQTVKHISGTIRFLRSALSVKWFMSQSVHTAKKRTSW